jgi:hypothetical protein
MARGFAARFYLTRLQLNSGVGLHTRTITWTDY